MHSEDLVLADWTSILHLACSVLRVTFQAGKRHHPEREKNNSASGPWGMMVELGRVEGGRWGDWLVHEQGSKPHERLRYYLKISIIIIQ